MSLCGLLFCSLGVKTVINLEVQGEHASCGDGNEPSGFSYNPQELMAKKSTNTRLSQCVCLFVCGCVFVCVCLFVCVCSSYN